MSLAAEAEIDAFLSDHREWSHEGDSIARIYGFADFSAAMGFVSRVAMAAEKANHHPDIDIRWNKVTLTLSTHSEGGLTTKDLELAALCDGFV